VLDERNEDFAHLLPFSGGREFKLAVQFRRYDQTHTVVTLLHRSRCFRNGNPPFVEGGGAPVKMIYTYISHLSLSSKKYFQFDQLPPFNFTLLFNDETGYASYQRLLGVRLVSDGVIYSTQ